MKRSVLVIDDSPDIHALLDVRLAAEGVAVLHALTPDEGIALARARLPDLVLLDLEMPGRSGFEVCQELKASPVTEGIAVIFLTGRVDARTKVKGLDLGAVDYVTKPFDAAELRARVRSALRTKSLQDQLIALANIDALTRLWNRTYFDTRIADELRGLDGSGVLSLAMVDVDHFKKVNDVHGHLAGDAVLRGLGTRVGAVLRASDVACRYGGEELVLVLPGLDARGATVAMERVRSVVADAPFETSMGALPVTASIGVATTYESETPATLIARADEALYAAKRTGRNRVVSWRPLRAVG